MLARQVITVMDEFEIIDRFFSKLGDQTSDHVLLGPGDDCAVVSVPSGWELCVSTDTLVEGVHFPLDSPGELVAHRAFSASVSDLAAMGALPHSMTGALTMPEAREPWLAAFAEALGDLSSSFNIPLIGGNLSKGPLMVTMTVMGIVRSGTALLRRGAMPGDSVYVTGEPGRAAAGLALHVAGVKSELTSAYTKPTPRLSVGERLIGIASSAIDISDGLFADLQHICQASQVGAEIEINGLPVSKEREEHAGRDQAILSALTGGDDYELCFTVPERMSTSIDRVTKETAVPITRVGRIIEGAGVSVPGVELTQPGYRHFE